MKTYPPTAEFRFMCLSSTISNLHRSFNPIRPSNVQGCAAGGRRNVPTPREWPTFLHRGLSGAKFFHTFWRNSRPFP